MTQTPTDALRLVPVRATPQMIAAMDKNIFGQKMDLGSDFLHGVWASALAAAPASPLPGGGWQDISTAPKDGTEVLIYRDGWQEAPRAKWGDHDGENEKGESIVFGGWFMASEWFAYGCEDGFLGWNEDADVMPTHWMPLPAAPTGDA